MNIYDITKEIISMSKADSDSDVNAWNTVFNNFDEALEKCSDVNILAKCILEDDEWHIPFDSRMKLMEKTKFLGEDSFDFLADYYSFKTAFLDPGDEYDEAAKGLDDLFLNR